MDELTAWSVGSSLVAISGWLAAGGALLHGAFVRKGSGRLRFALAALLQLVSGPIAVVAAWWLATSWLARFGAEAQTLPWLAELAPAAALSGMATAIVCALAARSG